MRDARDDWRRYDAEKIPSKATTPHLDAFLARVQAASPPEAPLSVLDVGCGTGAIGRRIHERGFSVLGIDVNPDAVRVARALAPSETAPGRFLRFEVADMASAHAPRLDGGPFDVVVGQLVISIVGALSDRRNLLRHAHEALRPGGWLYLSASGVSDTISDGYARLYVEDFPLTGERHSYLSRDAEGNVLYMTHHFTPDELVGLLDEAGFEAIDVTTAREASSRRPDEAAFFHSVTCRAGA